MQEVVNRVEDVPVAVFVGQIFALSKDGDGLIQIAFFEQKLTEVFIYGGKGIFVVVLF